jgi:hypothetical protein
MIRAIPVPKSFLNPATNTWEVPGLAVPKEVNKKVCACKPVFSGDKAPVRAPWWKDVRADAIKCWKQQSVRLRQYRPK